MRDDVGAEPLEYRGVLHRRAAWTARLLRSAAADREPCDLRVALAVERHHVAGHRFAAPEYARGT